MQKRTREVKKSGLNGCNRQPFTSRCLEKREKKECKLSLDQNICEKKNQIAGCFSQPGKSECLKKRDKRTCPLFSVAFCPLIKSNKLLITTTPSQ